MSETSKPPSAPRPHTKLAASQSISERRGSGLALFRRKAKVNPSGLLGGSDISEPEPKPFESKTLGVQEIRVKTAGQRRAGGLANAFCCFVSCA